MSFIDCIDRDHTYADAVTVGYILTQSVMAFAPGQNWPTFSVHAAIIENALLDLAGCIDAPIE